MVSPQQQQQQDAAGLGSSQESASAFGLPAAALAAAAQRSSIRALQQLTGQGAGSGGADNVGFMEAAAVESMHLLPVPIVHDQVRWGRMAALRGSAVLRGGLLC